MALTKRLRYEILRRDNHTCRYCGAAAPDVALTVDHVIPTALGGTDEPTNLVAACKDCNAGKSASSPDAPLVAQVAEDALRWSRAIAAAAETMFDRREVIWQYQDAIEAAWVEHGFGLNGHFQAWRPADWLDSAERLCVRGLPEVFAVECVGIAMRAKSVATNRKWVYYMGICWRRLDEQSGIARELVDTSADAADDVVTDPRPGVEG